MTMYYSFISDWLPRVFYNYIFSISNISFNKIHHNCPLYWSNYFYCSEAISENAENLGKATIDAFRKMFKYIDDFWLTVKMAKVHNSEEFYFDKFNESNEQILNLHTDR
jgi:hypothetical protein